MFTNIKLSIGSKKESKGEHRILGGGWWNHLKNFNPPPPHEVRPWKEVRKILKMMCILTPVKVDTIERNFYILLIIFLRGKDNIIIRWIRTLDLPSSKPSFYHYTTALWRIKISNNNFNKDTCEWKWIYCAFTCFQKLYVSI